MSETVKLIIEIPKKVFEARKTGEISPWVTVPILDAVQNGTPLDNDSDRAEVQAYFAGQTYGWEQGRKALIDEIKAEIAEEICLTDNPYSGETKYTIEHSRLLKILDNIGKTESEGE